MVLGTTTQVVMPRMGDSVSEGDVLEWQQVRGRSRLRRRDARRDLDRQGRRRGARAGQRHARADPRARGRDRRRRRAARRDRRRRRRRSGDNGSAPHRPPATEPAANGGRARRPPRTTGRRPAGTIRRHRHPRRRRVGDARARSSAGRSPSATTSRAGDTVVEISTDKVDVELPAPAAGTITELLAPRATPSPSAR